MTPQQVREQLQYMNHWESLTVDGLQWQAKKYDGRGKQAHNVYIRMIRPCITKIVDESGEKVGELKDTITVVGDCTNALWERL